MCLRKKRKKLKPLQSPEFSPTETGPWNPRSVSSPPSNRLPLPDSLVFCAWDLGCYKALLALKSGFLTLSAPTPHPPQRIHWFAMNLVLLIAFFIYSLCKIIILMYFFLSRHPGGGAAGQATNPGSRQPGHGGGPHTSLLLYNIVSKWACLDILWSEKPGSAHHHDLPGAASHYSTAIQQYDPGLTWFNFPCLCMLATAQCVYGVRWGVAVVLKCHAGTCNWLLCSECML